MEYILELSFIIIIPIIPAVLIYRFIPNQIGNNNSVTTKYLGVSVKLSGAFAGYFALVLLMVYILKDKMTNDKEIVNLEKKIEELKMMYEKKLEEKYKFYTIQGQLESENVDPRGKFDFNIKPPQIEMYSDGHFFLKDVPITFRDDNIPILTITKINSNYLNPLGESVVDERVIMLRANEDSSLINNPYEIEIRDKNIKINTPIVFAGANSSRIMGGY